MVQKEAIEIEPTFDFFSMSQSIKEMTYSCAARSIIAGYSPQHVTRKSEPLRLADLEESYARCHSVCTIQMATFVRYSIEVQKKLAQAR